MPIRLVIAFVLVLLGGPSVGHAARDCRNTLRARLPITFHGALPVVPAVIDGQPVSIGIDTGSENTIITPEAAARLGLSRDRHRSTKVFGTGGMTRVHNAVLDALDFAGVRYGPMSVAVIALGGPGTSDGGPDVVGLIGVDVLSHYDIGFNPPEHILSLFEIGGCGRFEPPWRGAYAKLPVTVMDRGRLAFPVTLDGHTLTAIFDTGSHGVELALGSAARAGVTRGQLASDPRRGGSGLGARSYQAALHQFATLSIGAETFRNPRIAVVDFRAKADMLIGEDYMHSRRFWLSYAGRFLAIQRLSPLVN